MEPVAFELALELGTDFADILSVKARDFSLGDPSRAEPLPEPVAARYEEEHNQFVLEEPNGEGAARTQVILSQRGEIEDHKVVYRLELGAARELGAAARHPRLDRRRLGHAAHGRAALRRGADARARVARGLAAARATGAGGLGPARPVVLPVGVRPRLAADARRGPHRPDARGRDAVVHDRLRPRHADHVPPDAALRAGAGAHRARGAGRAAGTRRQRRTWTPSRARSSTSCAPARPRRSGSAPTTAPSTRRRSSSCCSRRSGAGPTTRRSCAS